MAKVSGEKSSPTVVPLIYVLRNGAMACFGMETKFTGWRVRPMMEICEPSGKFDRFCWLSKYKLSDYTRTELLVRSLVC